MFLSDMPMLPFLLLIRLAKNWVPPLTLTPLWLPSLFLLLDLTGCVWRILTCHCTSVQSTAIDEILFQHLLSTAQSLSTCSQALLSALLHTGDWLNGVPSTTLEWVFTFRTRSFALAYMLLAGSASTLLLLLLP